MGPLKRKVRLALTKNFAGGGELVKKAPGCRLEEARSLPTHKTAGRSREGRLEGGVGGGVETGT